MTLEECNWTVVEVEQGAVMYAFWTRYPVVKYQRVMWFAGGDAYTIEGYIN